MMRMSMKESSVVRPAGDTPRTTLWISNLDMMMQLNYHTLVVYFFPFNGDSNFFNSKMLKDALSRALVPFYPMAGRLKMNGNRIEIDCNGEGVSFSEAEVEGQMDELEDFYPKPNIRFCPVVDYSSGISSYPLFLAQVNRFKCGGVCLGIATEHHVVDGAAGLNFINTWAGMARGLDVKIQPFMDRRAVFSARNPPQPKFTHIEYQPHPTLKTPNHNENELPISFKRFKFTRDQINALKAKCNQNNTATNYTTFEVASAHIWRCVTKVRQLPEDQATKLYIPVDGRSRLRPPIPQGYVGNVLFHATPIATAGELVSKPLEFSVDKVHNAIARMDHDYLMSALDYLELQDDLVSMARGPHNRKSPNLVTVAWARMPFYDANFGWGKPVYVGQGSLPTEGVVHVMGSLENDNSTWVAIALPENRMKRLEGMLYEDILV